MDKWVVLGADGSGKGYLTERHGLKGFFTARRGCGRTVPNRCRQRAKSAALRCMQEHTQSLGETPAACSIHNGIEGYTFGNMQQTLHQAVCKYMEDKADYLEKSGIDPFILPESYQVVVWFSAFIEGDAGCGSNKYGWNFIDKDLGTKAHIRCP